MTSVRSASCVEVSSRISVLSLWSSQAAVFRQRIGVVLIVSQSRFKSNFAARVDHSWDDVDELLFASCRKYLQGDGGSGTMAYLILVVAL